MDIREARKEDCREILKLIQEHADEHNMPDGLKIGHEVLERDGFETDPPLFKGIVAVDNGKIVGEALYCYNYSPTEGRSMILKSLYLTSEYRNKGIGCRMFDIVAKKAAYENCCKLDFAVLNSNPVLEMYKRKGVVDITKANDWHLYHFDSEALKKYRSSS